MSRAGLGSNAFLPEEEAIIVPTSTGERPARLGSSTATVPLRHRWVRGVLGRSLEVGGPG